MIRIKGTPYQNSAGLIAAASGIAEYYGFTHFQDLPRVRQARPLPPGARPDAEILFARRDERSLPSAAKALALSPRPHGATLAWRVVSLPPGGLSFELHVAGVSSSIAEAILLVAADAIIKTAGVKSRALSVNNIGGPESSARFLRDVGSYLRKHIETIALSLRPRAASDPVGALVQLIERGHPAVARAPQAMEYLTEDERRRFWDFLEYLEVFGIPYELSGQILGSRDIWAHALFEITTEGEDGARATVGSGGRYDTLISRFARQPLCAAMIAIHLEQRGSSSARRRVPGVRPVYFAHLGIEARRRVLPLLETLRLADIPVYHGLWHERIGAQMAAAQSFACPYILIMGHKEAVEGTVLVREVATNSQEGVPLSELTALLKRRGIGTREAALRD